MSYFDSFVSLYKLTPQMIGLLRLLLSKEIEHEGKIVSMKKFIDDSIASGWKVKGTSRERWLISPDGLTRIKTSKTGFTKLSMDYAFYVFVKTNH